MGAVCGMCGQLAADELAAELMDSSSPTGRRTVRGCTAAHLEQLTGRPWEAGELLLTQLVRAQDELVAEQAAAGVPPMTRPSLEEAARRARLTPDQVRRAVEFNGRRLRRLELELAATTWTSADSGR